MQITIFFVIGWLTIVGGLFMIYRPLGVIVAGALLVLVALIEDKRKDKE